ncbi:MAG: esterase [Prochlorococcus sp. SP3034]|nr:esterase [Prochlorococcus sp. SP3034]|tara:strand:+ start:5532 stop:6149 length:618 start_codon:yes stop_codon:yes gene_type:complete
MKSTKHHEYVSIGNQNATHRIILLHGWGADADDLLPVANEIIRDSDLVFEIISLRAPNINPENNCRQWYGLFPSQWEEAKREVEKLQISLKEFDFNKIPLKKTILLGFSQGAAMAIDAGTKLDLGLIVACSGYSHPGWMPPKNIPKVLLTHGLKDEVVPICKSREIYKKLKIASASNCELIEFDGNHEIDISILKVIHERISLID